MRPSITVSPLSDRLIGHGAGTQTAPEAVAAYRTASIGRTLRRWPVRVGTDLSRDNTGTGREPS